ncbi:metallophosphoesterase [Chondrocystis sp. NIES-4102]|nr:metallophosphoesterase [Chondrocystis sp. NIES-4102]
MKIGKLILTNLVIFILIAFVIPMTFALGKQPKNPPTDSLLSDPFLQAPTENTVNIVWFTEFAGTEHYIKYGQKLEQQVIAKTTKLSRVREDQQSYINTPPNQSTPRNIWRHEAIATGLIPNQRVPYQVVSIEGKQKISSKVFTLASQPSANSALKILLTSDHQLMPMTTANLSQVVNTIDQIDAVFCAGDLVNIPDRASEWFDDLRGGAFFPSLQGRGNYELEHDGIKTIYHGGEIIQHAPLFTALGNHEVMGRLDANNTLKQEFANSKPRQVAKEFYQQLAFEINPTNDPQLEQDWIKNNSFNTDTYEEIFSLPQSSTGGKRYYATTFGDIHLISLYATNIWRSPGMEAETQGRYKESVKDLNNPNMWAGDGKESVYQDLSKLRIYKPIWKVILERLKSISSKNK